MICSESKRKCWEEKLFFCECLSCLGPKDPYKKSDELRDEEERERRGLLAYSEGGPKYTNLVDDGEYVGIFDRPIRVGSSILLWGKRNAQFPAQCMIGPDWPCTVVVYILILGAHGLVLPVAAPCLGWIPLIIGFCGFLFLMYVYSAVACTNPGMVLQMAPEGYAYKTRLPLAGDVEMQLSDIRSSSDIGRITGDISSSVVDASAAVAPITTNATITTDDVALSAATAGTTTTTTYGMDAGGDCEKSISSEDSEAALGNSLHAVTASLLKDQDKSDGYTTEKQNDQKQQQQEEPHTSSSHFDVERVSVGSTSVFERTVNTIGSVPAVRMYACGQCQFDRSFNARHCGYCGACIEGLDHHCPWSGKCIGENNIKLFHWFVGFVCFEIYFIGGVFIYYLAACEFDKVPRGEGL